MEYLLIVLLVLAIIIIAKSIRIVQQSRVLIVERLGKYHKTCTSGLNLIVPFVDSIRSVIDLRVQVLDSEPQPVITKDNVGLEIDTVVYYQITDPYRATYEIANLVKGMQLLTLTTLRDISGTMELDQTLSSRDLINNKLRVVLDEATDKWGVRVERVEVKSINPPSDIKMAMEAQMRAEREKRAAILTAEGLREAEIRKAEGDKQAQILRAEAEREANIKQAEGRAKAIELVAVADARRIDMVMKALKDADMDEKMLTMKSIEAFVEMTKSPNKVFVPYEAAGVMGSLGAIKELLLDPKTVVK
ncbi:MAG: SPFH/Band 7/PHB domain protein [Firmicutes bacterium]|nr:SPFH/Band 7/PHB domain protein [Bacillota bacterium]